MMVGDEASHRLADDQADIQGLAGILSHCAAGAFQGHDVIRIAQYDVTGQRIGDHLLQVLESDLFLDHHQLPRRFQRNDFAVIGVSKSDCRPAVDDSRREDP